LLNVNNGNENKIYDTKLGRSIRGLFGFKKRVRKNNDNE